MSKINYKLSDPFNRLLSRVKKIGSCWIWTGTTNNKGYGLISYKNIRMLTHRLMYEIKFPQKDISNLLVTHQCDVRRCIRPSHLKPGTPKQNTDDMIRKGRWKRPKWHRGTEHHSSKLSKEAIIEIRKMYVPGKKWGTNKFAKKYGVERHAISRVASGKSY